MNGMHAWGFKHIMLHTGELLLFLPIVGYCGIDDVCLDFEDLFLDVGCFRVCAWCWESAFHIVVGLVIV